MSEPGKTIILFRHAKSDWDTSFGSDHDRPLASRGIKDAGLMGRLLAQADQVPQLVLCSTAKRAVQTLELAKAAGDWQCPVEYRAGLYLAQVDGVLKMLRSLPSNIDSVLLVGHEPTWSSLSSQLIGGGQIKVSTGALLRFDTTSSWEELGVGDARLAWSISPKLVGHDKGR